MSVEVANETEWQLDPKVFSELGLWVMHQMRVSTQSELTITFVDPEPIAELHERWMDLQGPTDVMSFPMDELRPGDEQERQMFGLQRQLLLTFFALHHGTAWSATLPSGSVNELEVYERKYGTNRELGH